MRPAATLLVLLALLPLAACNRATDTERVDSAIALVKVPTEGNAAENRAAALHQAELFAKDQILYNALSMTFPNGITLEEAAIADPFIRAKLYDTIRTAQVIDRAITEEGIASVEVQMSLEPMYDILAHEPPPIQQGLIEEPTEPLPAF